MKIRQKLPPLLRLMRPWHYGKNALVFVPLFFSGKLFADPERFLLALLGFVAMSLAASGVYMLNDCRDAEMDALHPQKKHRPVASGEVKKRTAMFFGFALLFASLALPTAAAAALGTGRAAYATAILAAYIAMNVLYSLFGLKNVPILDVTIVAAGFLLRLLFGSALTAIEVSDWLLLTVLAGSYYMAFGKRRGEFRRSGAQTRAVLGLYTADFLNQCVSMFLTLTIAFYSLWSVSVSGRNVLSVPLVVLIALCYQLDIEKDENGDPVEVLLADKKLLVMLLAYVLLMIALIYKGGAL